MRSWDEVLRLARELSAPDRRRLVEELERVEEESLSREEREKAWVQWVEQGPQGPIEDEDSPWP